MPQQIEKSLENSELTIDNITGKILSISCFLLPGSNEIIGLLELKDKSLCFLFISSIIGFPK